MTHYFGEAPLAFSAYEPPHTHHHGTQGDVSEKHEREVTGSTGV